MRVPEGRLRAVLLVVAALVIVGSAVVPPGGASQAEDAPDASRGDTQQTPENLKIVTVHRNSSEQLWPYTSRAKAFDTATLPINVIVIADPLRVRYLLTTSEGARWQVTDDRTNSTDNRTNDRVAPVRPTGHGPAPGTVYSTPGAGGNESEPHAESGVVLNGTDVEWISARGSTRYTYIHNRTAGSGRWTDETYQLHDGTYFGTRYHARLYGGSSGEVPWTALQVHREHWDWFRLRHTVDSVGRAQDYFEQQFFGTWFTLDVERRRFANAGALDSDGWVTVVDLSDRGVKPIAPVAIVAFPLVVFGMGTLRNRERDLAGTVQSARQKLSVDLPTLLLFASLALLPLAVRVGSIAVELTFRGLSPKPIAAVFYLLLVTGPPLAAFAFSRGRGTGESVVATIVGLGVGIFADYLYLGVAMLPIRVVVHRAMLMAALGVLAAGWSRTAASSDKSPWNVPVMVGITAWIGVLLLPLLDVL